MKDWLYRNYERVTIAFVIIGILLSFLVCVLEKAYAAPVVALIDPDPQHAATMLRVAPGARLYSSPVLVGMREAYLDGVQIAAIPYYFGRCDDLRMGAVSNALRDLATVAVVYIPAVNCPALSEWSTFVGLADEAGNKMDDTPADVWANCFFERWCSYSYATMRAANNAK